MKRTYIKPALQYEDFTPSRNISGNCEFQEVTVSRDIQGCGYLVLGNMVFFVENMCEGDDTEYEYYIVEDGDNGFCYHNPTDTTNLFNS
jgi:hypothetical protein